LFVLKRLSDAIAENDRIYGVIRGVAANQCGNACSITHPHAGTQATLFQKLLSKAGLEPRAVSVMEAHGTGTQVFCALANSHVAFAWVSLTWNRGRPEMQQKCPA
jgi:acyl transferase domain-containing protein